tara:strand:+ start:3302 stop:3514 length:213 start_codon:yes stop_codon:yes gene_type:complete
MGGRVHSQDVFGKKIESTFVKDRDIEDTDNEQADVDYAALQDKINNPIRWGIPHGNGIISLDCQKSIPEN